ncbi:MAG TPA: carbohydrate porin, partial [Rhodopila sp.]|nr:carbohydrate porin [Rhodopila sp.]
LSVFGGALVYSGNSPNWGEYYLGVLDRGPFAARPHDTIGLVADVIANNSAVRPNKPTQETFELNYGISVAPGLTVKPYTQYVIAPTNADSPLGSSQPKDAWVVGVQVVINVAELLHLPQFVAH